MSDFSYLVSAQPGTESVGQLATAGATAAQRVGQGITNQKTARDLWNEKKLAAIMSRNRWTVEDIQSGKAPPLAKVGDLNAEAALAAAQGSDLVPRVRDAIYQQEQSELAARADIAAKRQGLGALGVPTRTGVAMPEASRQVPVRDPLAAPDPTGFVTQDMREGSVATGGTNLPADGVRIAGRVEAMPEPEYMTQMAAPRSNVVESLDYEPKTQQELVASMMGGGMQGGGQVVSLAGKDPRYVATATNYAQLTGQAGGGTPAEVEAGLQKVYNTKREAIAAKAAIPMQSFASKEDPTGINGWMRHVAEVSAQIKGLDAEFATMFEPKAGEYSDQAQKLQASGLALTDAQNKVFEQNAERGAIGKMVGTANDYVGLNLDPSKFTGEGAMKEARDITGRVIQNRKAQDLLEDPAFLKGDWHKVITEVQTIKAAVQASDKIPGTESGEMALIGMMAPNLNPLEMKRLGLLHDGGLTDKGWSVFARYMTSLPQDEVKQNLSRMLKHSTGLAADVKKYSSGYDKPSNTYYSVPQAVANPFGGTQEQPAPAKAPTPAEIAKMPPKEAMEAKRRAFKGKAEKKAEPKADAGVMGYTKGPDGVWRKNK